MINSIALSAGTRQNEGTAPNVNIGTRYRGMVNINPPQRHKLSLCNEEIRVQFILSTGHSVIMWLRKVSFSSLAATCVKKNGTKKGKFGRDQIHEKSKER